jgi:anti-anti-sigma factor
MSDSNREFAQQLEELRLGGDRLVVLDGSELEYVNSQAIGDLMVFHHDLLGRGGRLALAGLRPAVDKVVRAVGLAQVISVFESTEDALAALKAKG